MFEMMAGRSPFDIVGSSDNPDQNTEDYLFQGNGNFVHTFVSAICYQGTCECTHALVCQLISFRERGWCVAISTSLSYRIITPQNPSKQPPLLLLFFKIILLNHNSNTRFHFDWIFLFFFIYGCQIQVISVITVFFLEGYRGVFVCVYSSPLGYSLRRFHVALLRHLGTVLNTIHNSICNLVDTLSSVISPHPCFCVCVLQLYWKNR